MSRVNLINLCIFPTIFAIAIFIQSSNTTKPKQNLLDIPRVKSLSCNFSDDFKKMIYSNSTCKLVQNDKRMGAMTIYVMFKQPVYSIIVNFQKTGA